MRIYVLARVYPFADMAIGDFETGSLCAPHLAFFNKIKPIHATGVLSEWKLSPHIKQVENTWIREGDRKVNSIIVASDLSERSRQAVRRGVNLAADLNTKLTVLHVVDDAMPTTLSNQVQREAAGTLSDEVATDADGRKINHEIKVVVGDTIEEINAQTRSSNADLLIVGLHRRRVFLDHIKETTMEHLIRSSRLPVLLVANKADEAYTRVLGGVDLSRVCASALHKIRMIAPQAELTLFHAHEVSFRKEAERDYATWKAVSDLPGDLPDPVFVEARARDALHEVMDKGRYDLLAIGAHTRSNAGRYILGGFSAGLIRNPPCDLLLAK